MKLHLPLYPRLYFLVLFVLLMGMLAACSKTAAPINVGSLTHIRVVMDNNYPPYAFKDKQGKMQGILVDQWKLWGERTGLKVEVIGLPWDQALGRMKNGEFDVIDTIFYTVERAKIFDFTKPYADIGVHIFFPSNVSGIANVESLQGFRVAVKTGDADADYLIEHGVDDLVYYKSYEEIVKAAADKKETIFVIDQPPALYFLYKYGIQDQFNYSPPLYGGQFHRAVKKGNTALLKVIDSGFANISAKEYQQIDDRWFGTNQYTNLSRIMPYLGMGAGILTLLVAILIIFNRTLQSRVKTRTHELEQAAANLKTSETRFREAIEFLPIPISIANSEGSILEFNRQFEEHYGYTLNDISTVSAWMLRAYPDPEYREKVIAQWNRDATEATREQKSTPMREYKVTGKDGRLHDVEIIMRAVGNLWIVSFVEITERKRAEIALREAETKYRALIENAPEVIYLDSADELSSNIYISTQIENLLGYTPTDFAENPHLWHEIVHPQDYQRAFKSITNTLVLDSALEEYRMIKRDGSEIWVRDTSRPIRDENGQSIFIQGFLQDITERKKVEEKLKQSEERYRTLFEDSPVALLEEDFSEAKKYIDQLREKGVADFQGYFKENPQEIQRCAGMVRVTDVNKAIMHWYQMNNKIELQVKLMQLMNSSAYESFSEELLLLIEGNTHYEIADSRLDHKGNPLHIIVSGTVVPNYEETWGRVLISIVDITERKQAEERILRLNRLYATTSQINQTIVRERNRETLFKEICRVAIEHGQFRMVWIGLVNEVDQRIIPVVFAGEEQGYLKTININYRDEILGQGPTGTAVREDRCTISQDIATDPRTFPWRQQALQHGYRSSAAVPIHERGRVIGVLSVYAAEPYVFDEENKKLLDEIGLDISFALDSISAEAERRQAEAALLEESALNAKMANDLQLAYDTTLEGWSHALDLRDKETEGHTRRVTELTLQLARKFGFDEEDLIRIKRGALLHDIGKMGIPDSILLKPGKLTDEEWVIMRKHPVYAYEMLSPIKYLEPALDIPHYHHEWWDGTGYPSGLKGEQIPLTARIFAVADVWDALTSDRPYRAAWTKEKVKEYLREGVGKQFDQRVMDVFFTMLEHGEV